MLELLSGFIKIKKLLEKNLKEFSKLVKRIGLKENINLDIPRGDLGFVRASVEIQINQGGVQNLLTQNALNNYGSNLDSSIEKVLSVPSERRAFCKTKTFFNTCKKIVKKRTFEINSKRKSSFRKNERVYFFKRTKKSSPKL